MGGAGVRLTSSGQVGGGTGVRLGPDSGQGGGAGVRLWLWDHRGNAAHMTPPLLTSEIRTRSPPPPMLRRLSRVSTRSPSPLPLLCSGVCQGRSLGCSGALYTQPAAWHAQRHRVGQPLDGLPAHG